MKSTKILKAENHPFKEFTLRQKQAIDEILNYVKSGTKYIILEAPTGSGKSSIAVEVLRSIGGGRILTSQVLLQNQYKKDYPEFELLKGSSKYKCDYNGPPETVVRSGRLITTDRKSWSKIGITKSCSERHKWVHKTRSLVSRCGECPYEVSVNKAITAKYSILNYHSFYYQNKNRCGVFNGSNLVLDEAHNINKIVTNLYTREFLEFYDFEFYPKPKLSEGKSLYLTDKNIIEDMLVAYRDYIESELGLSTLPKRKKAILSDKLSEVKFQINNINLDLFAYKLSKFNKKLKLECVPINVKGLCNSCFYASNKTILFMSATIIDKKVFCKEVGISEKETAHVIVKSSFDPDNHKIKYIDKPYNMKSSVRETSIQKIKPQILDIIELNENKRGIIHTQTYAIAEDIVNYLRVNNVGKRITFSKDYLAAVEAHKNKVNSILISPSIKEGVSFNGELSEFQILVCVPYPPWDYLTEKRMKYNPGMYRWYAAVDFLQSLGRSVRSPKDRCDTYLCDARFSLLTNYIINKDCDIYLRNILH